MIDERKLTELKILNKKINDLVEMLTVMVRDYDVTTKTYRSAYSSVYSSLIRLEDERRKFLVSRIEESS